MQHDGEHITVAGTITGTIFSVAATIDHQDYYKTDDFGSCGSCCELFGHGCITMVVEPIYGA
jgi:hypothetical protein